MSPTTIGIANFKAFGFPLQEIPLRPITLIFGPNSAGKSSVIHSLLWINHWIKGGELDVRFPRLSDGKVDLGGFHQTIHRHESERRIICTISFPTSALSSKVSNYFRVNDAVSLDLSFGQPPYGQSVQLLDYRLNIDGDTFLSAIRKGEQDFVVSSLEFHHRALTLRNRKKFPDEEDNRVELLTEKIKKLNLRAEGKSLLAAELNKLRQDYIDKNLSATEWLSIEFDGILPVGLTSKGSGFKNHILRRRISDLVGDLHRLATNAMSELEYIPPLRDLPPRFFDLGDADSVWHGLFEDPTLLKRVNAWLKGNQFKTKYELEIAEFFSKSAMERELPPLLQGQLGRVSLSRPEGNDSYPQELEAVIAELQGKYADTDIESFLRSQPDLLERVISREIDVFRDGSDECYKNPHSSGKDYGELNDTEIREHVDHYLNWEVAVGIDALGDGDSDALELFQRWALNQPLLLELFDRHGDPSVAVPSFFKATKFERQDVRREILLRHVTHKTQVSLQDVGVGVSQVLPVIVHAFGGKQKLIAIEQPEIHIHPALQAELGDVFIESALGGNKNTFLLETHSEHLILRILRRIRETTEGETEDWPEALRKACPKGIQPCDVAILYVEPGEDGARVIELPVDANGEFTCAWPGGFFDDRMKELF